MRNIMNKLTDKEHKRQERFAKKLENIKTYYIEEPVFVNERKLRKLAKPFLDTSPRISDRLARIARRASMRERTSYPWTDK